MINFFGFLIVLGLFSSFCSSNNSSGNNSGGGNSVRTGDSAQRFYGDKIKFWQNQPVKFADFNLTFVGKRQVVEDLPKQANGDFPSRTFVYYDFKVEAGKEAQTISWSSGTGDIAPVQFTVGGKSYELELGMSDKLGKLAEDELIVWKKQ